MKKLLASLFFVFTTLFTYGQQLHVASYNVRYANPADEQRGNGWSQRCPVICNQIAYESFDLVGVTGTNGKTTTVTLLYDLVRALGHKAGLISTVVYKVGERTVEATHTTPDPVRLNAMMREMADEGCEYCFMECSSHAIVQERTRGLHLSLIHI